MAPVFASHNLSQQRSASQSDRFFPGLFFSLQTAGWARGKRTFLRASPSPVGKVLLLGMLWWGGIPTSVMSADRGDGPHSPDSGAEAVPPKEWKINVPKEGDHVTIIPQKEGVLVEISSKKGIGQATIERLASAWPKKVVLRLRLRGLEWLRVQSGNRGFEASVMSYPPYQTRLRVHGPDPMPPVDPKSPFWVEVKMLDAEGKTVSKIPMEGGYFEVVIPPAFLEKSPQKMDIHWIDFYRD